MKSARLAVLAFLFVFAARPALLPAQIVQERLDMGALEKIRHEGLENSHMDSLAGHLMDVIGPRLTGSNAIKRGNEWAADMFKQWGMANITIEPWDSAFGRGWEQVSYAGRIIEPFVQQLNATSQAWSGSTRGSVTCPVVSLDVKDTTDFAKYDGKVRSACILIGAPQEIGPEFEEQTRRYDADSLVAWMSQPQAERQGRRYTPEQLAEFRARRALQQAGMRWIRTQRAAAVLMPSGWTYGILRTGGHPDGRTARDSVYNPIPALLVGHEQYSLMYRNALRGIPVRLELNVQNRFLDDRNSYNVLAEIPGTDLADQVVMVGAHFDSWHSGTGATDDGAGSVVMMEAMRILKTLDLPMRRTVRIGLWSGEEQGLIGSRTYVRMHKNELDNISAYFNVDNGTGRLRGIWNQSNPNVNEIFEQILAPLRDLGVMGVRSGNTGGTDHLAFDAAGVPGFNYIQDPIEYGFRTHHSNVDTYERLVLDDLRQAATVVAWTVYTVANRDEMMPRKPAAEEPPQAGGGN
ncbi:MAG TPA: M20/M25/M40 family metallo-hydrolase [Gemmatimonadales bacterium]|nr:M20/M25/M40 family metallo-hydrolase [Gemmatimonadales bacterium]